MDPPPLALLDFFIHWGGVPPQDPLPPTPPNFFAVGKNEIETGIFSRPFLVPNLRTLSRGGP